MAIPLELELLEQTPHIEAIAPEWAALWARCPEATPYQHPAWLLPWWRRLWGGGGTWWLALREGGRLAGLAPLFVWGGERRCVSLAGSGISDYLDFLVEPEFAASGTALVLDFLRQRGAEWDLCDFQELRAGSPLLAAAAAEPCSVCPVLSLPASWEELSGCLPKKFRTDLRRAANRVRNAGGELQTAGAGNLSELLEGFFRLHAARWNGRGECGVAATPALRDFYGEAAAELFKAGMLRLHGLRIGGDLAAVLYGFAGHGRFYAYLDGFHPDYARYSPGTVLVGMAVERAIAEGCKEFDFLRKSEEFKYLWGARDRVNQCVMICHDRVS